MRVHGEASTAVWRALEFMAQRNLSEPAKFLSFHAKIQSPRSFWHMKRLK